MITELLWSVFYSSNPYRFINNLNRKKVTHLQKDIHDNQEDLFSLIESRDSSKIAWFYQNTISPKTRIARWNAFSYGSVKDNC